MLIDLKMCRFWWILYSLLVKIWATKMLLQLDSTEELSSFCQQPRKRRSIRISQASYVSISLGIAIGNRAKLGTFEASKVYAVGSMVLHVIQDGAPQCCLLVMFTSLISTGWWFGCHFYFPIYWECHHPTWLIFFQRGGPTTNQSTINPTNQPSEINQPR